MPDKTESKSVVRNTWIPQPWCGKRPTPCAKILGFSEMLISFLGLMCVITIQQLMISLEDEVYYIQAHPALLAKKEVKGQVRVQDIEFTLNSKIESIGYNCEFIKNTLQESLDNAMNCSEKPIPKVGVEDEGREEKSWAVVEPIDCPIGTCYVTRMNKSYTCPMTIHCKMNPWEIFNAYQYHRDVYEYVNESGVLKKEVVEQESGCDKSDPHQLTIVKTAALTLMQFTKRYWHEEQNAFSVVEPLVGRVEQKITHPGKVGYNPFKEECINAEMRDPDTSAEEVQKLFEYVISLLIGASSLSIFNGFLITTTGFDPSAAMIFTIFLLEILNVGIMIPAIDTVNDPLLCLLQYAGISPEGRTSPQYLQTTFTYGCSIYIVVIKGYVLWFLIAFWEVARKMPRFQKTLSKVSIASEVKEDYVASVADGVRKHNKRKSGGGGGDKRRTYEFTTETETETSTDVDGDHHLHHPAPHHQIRRSRAASVPVIMDVMKMHTKHGHDDNHNPAVPHPHQHLDGHAGRHELGVGARHDGNNNPDREGSGGRRRRSIAVPGSPGGPKHHGRPSVSGSTAGGSGSGGRDKVKRKRSIAVPGSPGGPKHGRGSGASLGSVEEGKMKRRKSVAHQSHHSHHRHHRDSGTETDIGRRRRRSVASPGHTRHHRDSGASVTSTGREGSAGGTSGSGGRRDIGRRRSIAKRRK